jgi:hypothetical protein
MKLLADILGGVGVIIAILLYQQKNRKSLLAFKLTLDLVWLVHYVLIGAYSGAAVAAIAALREIIFVKRDPKKSSAIIWLPIFISTAIVTTVMTWNNIFSLFTLFASCIAVISFFIGNPKLSRILAFPVCGCMLTYDVACRSVAGVVNESFAILSSLVGIIRLDRNKTEKVSAASDGDEN